MMGRGKGGSARERERARARQIMSSRTVSEDGIWPSSCAGRVQWEGNIEARCTCAALTSFDIPRDVIAVPSYAFANCKSLKTIRGLPTVKAFGRGAFAFSGLENMIWPEHAYEIPEQAFFGCDDFQFLWDGTTVNVKRIGAWAFASSGIQAFEWPPAVAEVAPFTFATAVKFHSISGMDSVRTVGSRAFSHAMSLRKVYLPAGCEVGPGAFEGRGASRPSSPFREQTPPVAPRWRAASAPDL